MTDSDVATTPSIRRTRREIDSLLHARGMYLGFYMAIGALIPFINLYYARVGLKGDEIALLAALPVLITSSTSVVWGSIADASHAHRTILRIALFLAPLSVLALSLARSFALLIALVAVYAFFFSPILPLIDSAALEAAKEHGRSYGNLRVWGTVGWSIATFLIGRAIQDRGIQFMFYGYAGFMGLTLLLAFFQPLRQRVLQVPIRHGLWKLIAGRGLLTFLISLFLVGMSNSAASQYMAIFLDRIGASESLIGVAASVAALSEIPVMFASQPILQRIGARGMLMMAYISFVLRWFLFAYVTVPEWALVLQLLHGLSFGGFLIGGVTYMYQHTPQGLGTVSQALFNSVAFGIASVMGSLSGGALYDRIGFPALFRLLSIIAALGLVLFYFTTSTHRETHLTTN